MEAEWDVIDGFNTLGDIWIQVLGLVDPVDLLRFGSTCHYFNDLVSKEGMNLPINLLKLQGLCGWRWQEGVGASLLTKNFRFNL